MFLNRPYNHARSSAPRFLLGAARGALFVLSFAGASLTLAGTVGGRSAAFNDLRLNHVPQASLRLGGTA
jgi:hypothetical protein